MVNGSLPSDWKWSTLGEICESPHYGWTTSASNTGNLHLLRTTDITSGSIDWDSVPFCNEEPEKKEKYLLHDGDIVISRAGSVGFSHLVKNPKPAVFASYLIRFKPRINREYVANFLQSPLYWNAISEKKLGIAIPNVNASKLKQIEIPVPPLPEQERIVSRIEELFSDLDAGVAALERVRTGLNRYKASVLKAAVTGKLFNGRLDSWEGKLPEGWRWVTLSNLLSEPLSNGKSVPNAKIGFPVLRLTALKSGRIDIQERKVGEWTKAQAKNYLVKIGDFFVSRGNGSLHLVGRGGLVEQEPDDVSYPDTLIRVRVSPDNCDIKYLRTIWASSSIRNQIETTARTTAGIYKINQKDLGNFVIPLPPLAEQRRIVAEIERRLSVVGEVESAVETGMMRAARLRQSVLKSAFEGRL